MHICTQNIDRRASIRLLHAGLVMHVGMRAYALECGFVRLPVNFWRWRDRWARMDKRDRQDGLLVGLDGWISLDGSAQMDERERDGWKD